jgi:tetratricopeptide (TPR) repeat protein
VTILKKIFFFTLIIFGSSSCFQEFQDLRQGETYLKEAKYQEAISLFDKHTSKKSKQLNSIAHKDYAVTILTNLETDKVLRYKNAKLLLREALDLDPTNQSAKALYKMLSKTMETELGELLE